MSVLNPAQFPLPHETRQIDGKTHQFVGWHVSQGEFQHNPKHRHEFNQLEARRGDIYSTYDPHAWSRRLGRNTATEVWKRTDKPIPVAHGDDAIQEHETTNKLSAVRLGPSYPASKANAHMESIIGRGKTTRVSDERGNTDDITDWRSPRLQSLMLGPNVPREAFSDRQRRWLPVSVRAVK